MQTTIVQYCIYFGECTLYCSSMQQSVTAAQQYVLMKQLVQKEIQLKLVNWIANQNSDQNLSCMQLGITLNQFSLSEESRSNSFALVSEFFLLALLECKIWILVYETVKNSFYVDIKKVTSVSKKLRQTALLVIVLGN